MNNSPQEFTFNNINRLWSYLIINEINFQNVSGFYTSPGLRNAPLLWATTKVNAEKIYSGFDERAQAYRAIGAYKKTGLPSVLLCTSGTAMANYYPAVIEAWKDKIPLIIISSDRPHDLVWGDHNQTIPQENMYGKFVLETVDLGLPTIDISPRALTTKVAQLIHKAAYQGGPVHLNIRFREPLDHSFAEIDSDYVDSAIKHINKIATSFHPMTNLPGELPKHVQDMILSSSKPLITVGGLRDYDQDTKKLIHKVIDQLGGLYHFDITSSLKFTMNNGAGHIPSPDHPEVIRDLKKDPPDLILHFGSRLTSKHTYTWLENSEIPLIQFGSSCDSEDPSSSCEYKIFGPTNMALQALKNLLENHKAKPHWLEWEDTIIKKEELIESAPISFAYISKKSIEHAPKDAQFYIGNSSIIRSFNNYSTLSTESEKKNFTVYSNRGVSGIEGFIACSLGLAEQTKDLPTYLFLGDISALHDLSSLAQLTIKKNLNLKIIILNNSGGGIFKLLPINNDKDQSYLELMTTPHQVNFKNLISALNIECSQVTDKESFHREFTKLENNKNISIIEVVIDDQNNINLFNQLKTIQ
tara:strand:- start:25050 stop:26801 length:1752 start_codon:yes stop_codon:yes gene_type:complete